MAKIKYDVKGVDPGGDRELPKPGVYRCKVISCVDAKPSGKDRRLEVQYQITDGDHKGFVLYDYINLESEAARWKLAQFIKACGLPASGTLDPDEVIGTGLSVRVKIQPETDQYAASARPATLLPLDGDEKEDLDADDDDTEPDDDDDDDDDSTYTQEELEELSNSDLKEVAGELEVEVPAKLTAKAKEKLIAAILEAQSEDDDEDEDGGGDDEEEYTWDDLSGMDRDELVELIEENELDVETTTGKGKKKKDVDEDDLRTAIAEELEIEVPDDEDDDEDDAPNYDDTEEWTLAKLKAEAKKRKLSDKGTRKAIVARLKKDDSPF